MEIDYSPYLFVAEDGEIWWSVETAIKLAAGFAPVTDERSEQGIALRAESSRCRADERSILASLNNPLPTVKPPFMVERDGERYLRAREFLPWLNAYSIAPPPKNANPPPTAACWSSAPSPPVSPAPPVKPR